MYNYDRGGNILSKVKYAYTTGAVGTAVETIPYVYGDSNWKDKLTSYNGQTITYDAIGNPLNDGTWTYTWQAGRQLKQMSAEGTSVSFKYDHNGMRVQKVVEQSWYPEITNYTYHGKILTHMMVDYTDFDEVAHQDKLHFYYDAQSRPAKVSYNGAIYTYAHNLQGDVVGLLDSSGTLVVEYKYDAWGKLLSTTGTLADTLGKRNPFRYRGYVYDEETELYYLQNRYYRFVWIRFINADSNVDRRKIISILNQFAYCSNNPIMYRDPSGQVLLSLYELFFMDMAGSFLFEWWLSGFGLKITIEDDEYWNNYFMKNEHFVATVKEMTTDAMTQRRADDGIFSERAHLDLSGGNGGGYRTGYDLINGTNADVGDFELSGTIYYTDVPNVMHVKARYTIHDIIDPNFDYGFIEKAAYVYCKLSRLWVLGGYDYELEISGNIEYDVEWRLQG